MAASAHQAIGAIPPMAIVITVGLVLIALLIIVSSKR